ncbi:MAG: STAS domain-containing protein [Succinatimonas sp.]|nr:STAS domain-containing protein [Succinatimonas sp.]
MEDILKMTYESVPALWERRSEMFKNTEIDLSTVTSIDSAGIAFLVQWSKALEGRKLKIKNPPLAATNLIATFALASLFEIENN